MSKISTILNNLEELNNETRKISIGELLEKFQKNGFAVILFIIAIPMALPLPVPPPLNFLFGLPLLFLTLQMVLGYKKPFLPGWVRNKNLPNEIVTKSITRVRRWLDKIDKIVKPRLDFLMGDIGYWLLGLCSFIMSLSIFTIYPMSNTVPSFFIAMASFGRITEDGLIMLAGLLGGLLWVLLLFVSFFLLGSEVIELFS